MTRSLTHDALARLSDAPKLPLLAVVAVRFASLLVTWETRRRTRMHLLELDDHLLRDVGLTRAQAEAEAARSFWQI